jgi:predicted ATPase/class 3 adenylate cyclase
VDIADWLRGLGLERYKEAFQENEVGLDVLSKLTAGDLKEIGVTPVGDRRRLLEAIAVLARGSQPAPLQAANDGAEARPKLTEAERRQLTVMFVDLVGSTEISAALDPEDMREVITAYQNCCAEVVGRFEGQVAKFMGDGVLVYFGYPQAHEDDAERAVRAGLELIRAVGRLVTPGGQPLATRVGIDTGLVVVGDLIGEGAAQEQAVIGDTPNLAARLQALADPNRVIISPSTHRLAGAVFEYEDLGTHEFKGVAEALPVWRVIAEGRVESRFEAAQVAALTPFVGRDAELAVLMDRWQRAKDGEGQVVRLCGEPGIGKSRLTQRLRERIATEPCARPSFQCSPHHPLSALYPIIRHFEHAAGLARNEPGRANLERLEALIARAGCDVSDVAPLFASLLSIDTADRYPGLDLSAQKQKQLTLRALVDYAIGLSREQPVVVIFEDVHWIDPTSQEVLDLLVPEISQQRILLVITHRPEYRARWSASAHLTTLTLTHLGRNQAAAMVREVAGSKSLPDEVLNQIVARTDGVPLFVEELTKSVLESGLIEEPPGVDARPGGTPDLAIPSTLRDSLTARLDRLAAAKEVAQIGACIGREFSYELIAAIWASRRDQLNDLLAQLTGSGLVLRTGSPPDATYQFRHALVQNAAYDSLLKSRRRALHAEIARRMASDLATSDEFELDVIAEQFSKGGVWLDALDYYRRAAESAGRRYALKEALALYDEALAAGGHLDADEAAKILMAIHQAKSELYFTIGDFGSSRSAYARGLEIARRTGDRSGESLALAGMAWAATWAEDFDSALANAREAIDVAEAIACQPALGNAHMTTGYVHALSGRLGPAGWELDKTLAICRSAGDVLRESLALFMSGNIENWRGEFDKAVDLASMGAAVAREHNLVAAFLRSNYAQALALTGRGDYDQALALLRDGLALAEKIGDEAFIPRYLNGIGWLHVECENFEPGLDVSNQGAELARQRRHATGVEMTCFAEVNMGDDFLARGDLKLAHEMLDKVHRTARNPATHEWMKWRYSTHLFASLGQLWLRRGNPGKAREFAGQCLKIAVPTGSRKYLIGAWLVLGEAALAQGDRDDAEKWLRRALKLARAVRHPPQLWRAHSALGQLYAASKRDRLAGREHRAALAVVEQIKRSTTDPGLRGGLEDSPRLRQVREQAAGG